MMHARSAAVSCGRGMTGPMAAVVLSMSIPRRRVERMWRSTHGLRRADGREGRSVREDRLGGPAGGTRSLAGPGLLRLSLGRRLG